MKIKEQMRSLFFKNFIVFALTLLFFAVSATLIYTIRFYRVYEEQVSSHMADVQTMATDSLSDLISTIDDLSIFVLTDQVVQDDLESINELTKENASHLYRYTSAIKLQLLSVALNTNGVIALQITSKSGETIRIGSTNQVKLEGIATAEEIYEANGGAVWERMQEGDYICLSRAILSLKTMQPLGYMTIVCENSYFNQRIAMLPNAYSSRVYVVDEQDQIVASSSSEEVGTQLAYHPEELRQSSTRLIVDPATGEESFYFVGEPISNDWCLVITVSAENVTHGLWVNLLEITLCLLAILLAALAVTSAIIRRLSKPTRLLLKSMERFGSGELNARVETASRDEIGQIGQGFNQMADNIQNLMEEVYSLELANKEAEIEFLKMQINPHFLYNTLDTISWMGFTNGCEEVSDLAVSLAQLLRASIKNDDIITVEQELHSVQDYLHIQEYRFQERFTFVCEIEPETRQYYMPNFLLQPLIENSIMHGLEQQVGEGRLTLRVYREDWLCFEVSDNGKGMEPEQVEALLAQCRDMKSRDSIGLKNVVRRLQLLYGEDCQFRLHSSPGEGTSVTFRIPIMTNKEGQHEEAGT